MRKDGHCVSERKCPARKPGEAGFTLIELLVVMIIIGILAAIAIPVFLSQKNKAKISSAKSDVSIIGKDVASYYVDGVNALTLSSPGTGQWQLLAGAAVVDSGKLSAGNTIVTGATITSDGVWCVTVRAGDTLLTPYSYSAASGLKPNACVGATN